MQPLIISVSTREPSVSIDDLSITAAPGTEPLYEVLGKPDRIDSGSLPAPTGHRNGQRHIYDALGVTMNEHHYTYRVTSLVCWFSAADPEYRFTPQQDFQGTLNIDGVTMPHGGDVRDFLGSAPCTFEGGFGGGWQHDFSNFCIFVSSRGRLLPCGRRSKVRNVTSVSLSWPHDPWQKPEELPPSAV